MDQKTHITGYKRLPKKQSAANEGDNLVDDRMRQPALKTKHITAKQKYSDVNGTIQKPMNTYSRHASNTSER